MNYKRGVDHVRRLLFIDREVSCYMMPLMSKGRISGSNFLRASEALCVGAFFFFTSRGGVASVLLK